MADPEVRHRLVAILAADAVGYSRLMSHDERRTVAAIEAARAVFRAGIEAHGGRVIDMVGDSVLAVFDAASGAVAASSSIQRQLQVAARSEREDDRLHFRIGVHLGDVIEKADGTVYGDGVNIAARLQALADPCGILVSDSVRMAARAKVAGTFEDRGEHRLKNIAEPMRTFRFAEAGEPSPGAGTAPDGPRSAVPATRWRLFGTPTVDRAGELRALPFERRSQLLAYLALRQGWVQRAELAALLWPEQAGKLALTNLRKTLFRLAASPFASSVDQHGGALRVTAPTDVAEFELALREGRLDDALAARRGELLEGFDDDANDAWSDWLRFERDRLRVAWRGAALDRIAAGLDPARAVELSTALLDADPLDEVAMQAHLSALARSGQLARARKDYRAFSERLALELGLAPGHALRALHERLDTAAAPAPPPDVAGTADAAIAAAPTPGPSPSDGFVGRVVELRRIAAMFADAGCRLLTLVGPGGIGKTSLARRAFAELAPRFADGAAFVALDGVATPALLADRVARALGVAPSRAADPMAALATLLGRRHTLLVLDNFEQLTSAAGVVADLLGACPGVCILVTTRVRLALAAEHLLAVDGLPSPAVEDLDEADSFDAVRLFVQAARRVEPALVPAAEAAAIADICRQVDGLPLAIELAAAWTRVLSCEAIAAELRRGSELLAATDAARPARHASIDVVFEHSWSMLGASEREVLARLAIFRGGFTAESARAVAAASLPVLGALGDKSLLRKEGARLSLHPLVRQLAGQRVDEAARGPLEQAHGQYFHRTLPQLRGAAERGDATALLWIETEFENCRVAWRWAIGQGRADLLLASRGSLLAFCDHRGRFQEGLGLIAEALEAACTDGAALDGGAGRGLAARLVSMQAQFEYRLDRYAQADATARRALALLEGDEADAESRHACLQVMGTSALRQGRLDEARRHFEQALRILPADRDAHRAASTLDHLALVHKALGDFPQALRLSLESLAQHRSLDDVAGIALCLNNLASLKLEAGEDDDLIEGHLLEALALSERHGLAQTRALALANLAQDALRRGALDAVVAHGSRALELGRAAGYRSVVAAVELILSQAALRRGDVDGATARLVTGLALANDIGRRPLQLLALSAFADVLLARGQRRLGAQLLMRIADQPDLTPDDRARVRTRLAATPIDEGAGLTMPLADLAHRIVVEAEVGQAPLIAELLAPR